MASRKRKTYAQKTRTKNQKRRSYFQAKAKNPSSSAQKKARRQAQKQQQRAINAASTKAKNQKAKKAKTRAYAYKTKKKSKIPSYLVSADIAKQKKQKATRAKGQDFAKKFSLGRMNTGLISGSSRRKRMTRFEALKRAIMIFIKRFLAWFSARSKKIRLTLSGKRALAQLEDLYNLLSLEAFDENALMRLKIAYGEASYYVTRASKGYYQKHKGKGKESYQPYFDRFVDLASD